MSLRSMVFLSCVCFFAAGLATQSLARESAHPKVTGIYSDMRYSQESGDVIGQEVFIVFSRAGYFAVLQSSEGEPSPPVVVPVKVAGSSVTFTVPVEMDLRGTFKGSISGDHLVGIFSGSGQAVDLERRSSYWE
ncbi:hypothetical protein [Dyella sp. 2RAB6]|uniref:hypothetical protein n=1 Tax=Dyella sp. 2RAB6 TaxID=3232992 RepID=UPI003F8DF33B